MTGPRPERPADAIRPARWPERGPGRP